MGWSDSLDSRFSLLFSALSAVRKSFFYLDGFAGDTTLVVASLPRVLRD